MVMENRTTKELKEILTQPRNEKREEIRINISKDLRQMESEMFKQLLEFYQGNKEKLCNDYNISRTTLWRKLTSR